MTVNLEFTYCNSNDLTQETAHSRSLKKILSPCDIIFIVFVVDSDFFTSESCVPDAEKSPKTKIIHGIHPVATYMCVFLL